MPAPQRIKTFLWYDRQAEEAAQFYVSLFPDSAITDVSRYGEGASLPAGLPLVVQFRLAGVEFLAFNGGPLFHLNEASSLVVECAGQPEIDRLWEQLVAGGGRHSQCGWLQDRYGLWWQVWPASLSRMMKNPEAAARVMQVLPSMNKLDLAALQAAAAGS